MSDTIKFKPLRPSPTGGGGKVSGDEPNRIRCYICGFIVDADKYTECPFCESDNFRGSVVKVVK